MLVYIIFTDANPVERIGQDSGYFSGFGRLIRGLNQAFDGQAIAKRPVSACGNVNPLRHIFATGRKLSQKLGRFCCPVGLAKDLEKTSVCLCCNLLAVPRRFVGRVEHGHRFPVFLGCFIEVPNCLCGLNGEVEQHSQRVSCKGGNGPACRVKAAFQPASRVPHISQATGGIIGSLSNLGKHWVKIFQLTRGAFRFGLCYIQF